MRLVIILSVILFTSMSAVVTACEGQCIVGITNAFLSNYSHPIITVLREMANIHPDHRHSSPPDFLIKPILSSYRKDAYTRLEHAIFPSYFHGKCQQKDPRNPNGPHVNPPGCPNPDCPVVCGTPGSLVHFYPRLRYIVYNETRYHLQTLATPGNKVYEEVERNFLKEAGGSGGAGHRRRDLAPAIGGTMLPRIRRQEQALKEKLRMMMRQVSPRLEKACGGTGTGNVRGLQKCSWDSTMKGYILSFP
ncbi:hypothetical protein J132_02966 [Termitomyces sp. J132]|nr:hypothetical protein J132_02966 [Termitomyces sp. J132]